MRIPFLPRLRKPVNLWKQIRTAQGVELAQRLATHGDATIPTSDTHYATGQDGNKYAFRFQSDGTPRVERLPDDLRDDSLAGAWD